MGSINGQPKKFFKCRSKLSPLEKGAGVLNFELDYTQSTNPPTPFTKGELATAFIYSEYILRIN